MGGARNVKLHFLSLDMGGSCSPCSIQDFLALPADAGISAGSCMVEGVCTGGRGFGDGVSLTVS